MFFMQIAIILKLRLRSSNREIKFFVNTVHAAAVSKIRHTYCQSQCMKVNCASFTTEILFDIIFNILEEKFVLENIVYQTQPSIKNKFLNKTCMSRMLSSRHDAASTSMHYLAAKLLHTDQDVGIDAIPVVDTVSKLSMVSLCSLVYYSANNPAKLRT